MNKFIPVGMYMLLVFFFLDYYIITEIYILNIYIYIFNHENNVPSCLSRQWLCGNSCTWGHDVHHVHDVPKCMSCHKAIMVITGRAHCFHDYPYILRLSSSDHLQEYIYYINTFYKYIPLNSVRTRYRLTYQAMSSTCAESQLCTATPISSFVQCYISFRLLPSSVATFALIEILLR